jgi:hypothetical protein
MLECLKDVWAGLWTICKAALWIVPCSAAFLLLEFFVPGSFFGIVLAVCVLYLLQQLGSIYRGK